MSQRFKLIISNDNVYKEISLPLDKKKYSIGTFEKNDVRLYRENYPDEFALNMENNGESWNLLCDENSYIKVDEIRKLVMIELDHGKSCNIISKKTGEMICSLLLVIDFNYEVKKYDIVLNVKALRQFSIGTQSDCNIVLLGDNVITKKVDIVNYGSELQLNVVKTNYGVCYNGNPILGTCRIKEKDFFSIEQFSFYFSNGQLFITDSEYMIINGIEFLLLKDSQSSLKYPLFNRNTNIEILVPEKELQILDPPSKPNKPNDSLLTHLVPAISMLVLVIVVRGFMNENANSAYLIFSVCSMGIGIFTSIFSYFKRNKEYKTEIETRDKEYKEYIQRKREEFQTARQEETDILNEKFISSDRLIKNINNFSGDLFDRNPDSDDFLKVRLGVGDKEASWKIKYHPREKISIDDELEEIPEKLSEEFKNLHNTPIVCDLLEAHNVGVVGGEEEKYQILKTIILDLCAHQYYSDVKMFFVFSEERAKQLSWIRFLPHVKGKDMYARNIICNEDSKTYHFEWIYKELCLREAMGKNIPDQHIIIFLIDDMGIKNHPISKYFKKAHTLNVHFISFENKKELLPMYCGQLIEMLDENHGILTNSDDSNKTNKFIMTPVSDLMISKAVMKLAPVYCEEISLESKLTKNISLFELLDIFEVNDLDLSQRWRIQDICKTMAAPLGVKAKDDIIYLDLHEKADGPHGLVAGTTGSGKSEIMQTYILSMATLYSPYDVAFVIIDFKGGGMVNQFLDLPHLVGAITDIDGKEINRSLLSIRAELDRRKELFAKAEVNNIGNYIKKFKNNDIDVPLPHLIIIVDEFAELKAEHPEFMKELISASRIGRSLGVHLILATQKPSGQVSDQIWSNSRFKLCLKVQTREDSNEVIKSPLAAEIIEPGRAYIQVGNNEKFELFQSAFSGAPEKTNSDVLTGNEFNICQVELSGKRNLVYEQKKEKTEKDSRTQLQAIVDYVHDYCLENSIEKLSPICLPPLSDCIEFQKSTLEGAGSIQTGIGIYDAPESQYQGKLCLNITGQNTIIIGSSQYGKTNLLQTIIRDLTQKYGPKEVNIYILDFGSMIFRNFEKLNHVGGVVYSYEEEKCKNLFKLLNDEIAKRKEILAQIGVSSFSAYKEAGFNEIPQIVLIIDNLTAMRELYLMENDFLLPICREGASLGITVIIANSQTSGIGYKYLSNFEQRISFTCNDTAEYNVIFNHCRMTPSAIPGRCLVELDKSIYEAQIYLAFTGKKEYDRVQNIKSFVNECNQQYPDDHAVPIPFVPELLTKEFFTEKYNCCSDKNQFYLGLSYKTVEPIGIDWMAQPVLAVSGSHSKNKNMFLTYLMDSLQESEAETYILDDYRGVFETVSESSCVSLYSRSLEDIGEIFEDIKGKLEDRYSTREIEGVSAIRDMVPIVLLIQNQEAINYISSDKKLAAIYKDFINKYKGLKCTVIFTDTLNQQISFSAPEVLKQMKDSKQFLIFDNLSEVKLFDCTTSVLKKYKAPLEMNEAYLLNGNDLSKIKIINPTIN